MILMACFFVCATACDRKQYPHYSVWYVNDMEESSNQTAWNEGKGGWSLQTDEETRSRGFYIRWRNTYAPAAGVTYPIYTGPASNDPSLLYVGIYKTDTFYTLSPHNPDSLTVTIINGKRQFTMSEAWFLNYNNSDDSIRVRGVFSEP